MPEKKHNPLTITTPSDRETVLTRVFDAPRELVFAAFTKPEHVAQWWGPRDSVVTKCEIDLRPGGAWSYTMRKSNGMEMTLCGEFQEVDAPNRIVSTERFISPELGNPEWTATITFEEHGGKTTFTNRLVHPTPQQRDGHLHSGLEGGAKETFDRMAELLEWQAHPMEREIEISYFFQAPRALVYEAWTHPKHMTEWWGPSVFTNHSCQLDVRPGGAWQIIMRSPDGVDYGCKGIYREIVPEEKLVFTNDAYDAGDKKLLEGLTTVTFSDASNGRTKLTLNTRAKGLVEFAPQMLKGMGMGWSQSFAKLAKLIAG